MRAHTARLTVLAALLALVLAGCSADPAPEPAPFHPAAAPTTPPPKTPTGPPPPTLPAAAKGSGERSAKAFLRYFVDVYNHAARTGDLRPLRTISTGSCETCRAMLRNIRKVYAAAGHVETDGWRFLGAEELSFSTDQRPAWVIAVDMPRQAIYDRPGAKPRRFSGGHNAFNAYLERTAHGWAMRRMDLVL